VRAALKRYDFQVWIVPISSDGPIHIWFGLQIFGAPPDFIGANLAGEKWFVRQSASTDLGVPLNLARETIAWIAANTFGRRILYPGSLAIFHSMANNQLFEFILHFAYCIFIKSPYFFQNCGTHETYCGQSFKIKSYIFKIIYMGREANETSY